MGHNPTGGVQSLQRKRDIYSVCRAFDIIIIEDEPYWYLQFPSAAAAEAQSRHTAESLAVKRESDEELLGYAGTRRQRSGHSFIDSLVPSFLSLDIDGRVIRLDTLSKTMAPGCRIGWITAQPKFIERLERYVSYPRPHRPFPLFPLPLALPSWMAPPYVICSRRLTPRTQNH